MGIFGLLANNSNDYAYCLTLVYEVTEWEIVSRRITKQNRAINFYYYHLEVD